MLKKRNWILAVMLLCFLAPLGFSLSIRELVSRYNFAASAPEINITRYSDFMMDKNGNGVNDTLIFELETKNLAGSFAFVVEIKEKDTTLSNVSAVNLSSGASRLNITFPTIWLSEQNFVYSIKVYNSNYSLKYRKDSIHSQEYKNYEKGIEIAGISDYAEDKKLKINVTINSTSIGIFDIALFLKYNDSILYAKNYFNLTNSTNNVQFAFDNESMKKTHYTGKFNVSSINIGKKQIKTDYLTSSYDYRNFAAGAFIHSISDEGNDIDDDLKYDFLDINVAIGADSSGYYNLSIAAYDLFGSAVALKDETFYLDSGLNNATISVNGSLIYARKLEGPFIVKTLALYKNGVLLDLLKDAHATGYYTFDDFDAISLADIAADMSVSQEYHYGISNLTVNFTIKNAGNAHAFNVMAEISDNGTFFDAAKSSLLEANSGFLYQKNFTDIDDFSVTLIADPGNLVEESNESNNVLRQEIKINKAPEIVPVPDIVVNETDKVLISISAFDINNDPLFYSTNFSKFSRHGNILEWNTTLNDSGTYNVNATVSDGFLSDSVVFEIKVKDLTVNDFDKDGIDDSIDNIIGNGSFINTTTFNIDVFVNGSSNLTKIIEGMQHVVFANNVPVLEFDFDFSNKRLNLSKITMNRQLPSQKGSLYVKGLDQYGNKTMYVDKITKSNDLCVKDSEISSIADISAKCNSANEFKVSCSKIISKLLKLLKHKTPYICTYNSSINKFKVQNLRNSAVIQIK